MALNYNIKDPLERCAEVQKELENPSSHISLEAMADYILYALPKEGTNFLTNNRMVTVNKRETSLEGITENFENNADQVYNLFTEDKNVIFRPSVSITPKDIEVVPFMKQLKEAIAILEEKQQKAHGKDKYKIKQALIELRKDQYILKDSYYQPIKFTNLTRNSRVSNAVAGDIRRRNSSETAYTFDDFEPEGFTLCDPSYVSLCLCNYSKLKQSSFEDFRGDTWYLMNDLEDLVEKALENEPRLKHILILKIDGEKNAAIKDSLQETFGLSYTQEYISSLWRNKIPRLIAKEAQIQFLEWYYTNVEKGKWKRCSKCGCIRLASPEFFSRNKTSKDGLYSICKKCRSVKNKNESN